MTLPDGVVRDSPVQVRPIVMMWKVSIDSLQQQLLAFKGKAQEVRVFLCGVHIPPHADDLYRCPPWDISVPVPIPLVILFFLLCRRLLPTLSGLMALLGLFSHSAGAGVCAFVPMFPPSLLRLCLRRSYLCSPFPSPLGCVGPVVCWVPGIGH